MSTLLFGALQAMSPGSMTSGGWRHPRARSVDYLDLEHWTSLATTLEAASFDFLFFADTYAYSLLDDAPPTRMFEDAANFPAADPLMVLSAVAAATKQLGIVVTLTTMTETPQHVARRLATLDNLSKGRMGWNIVTGAAADTTARIFGAGLTPHDERYDRADDFVDLALKLLEGTWEDGAVVNDRDAQVYIDPTKVREIEHDGPYFTSRALLPVPPSPQRTPLLFQAGSSARGRHFAAKYSEAVFLAGGNPKKVKADIAAIRGLAETEYGRDPMSIRFLVGALFVAAETSERAQAKLEDIMDLTTLESAILDFHVHTGIDLTDADLSLPIQEVKTDASQSTVERYNAGREQPLTAGEILAQHQRKGVNGLSFVGDAVSIADEVEAYIAATGADGFLLEPFITPGTYDDFIEFVLPELRRRGLAKAAYTDTTLREHVHGTGNVGLPDSHPGARYRANASASAATSGASA